MTFFIPFSVRNRSRRKISDIVVELNIPSQLAVKKSELHTLRKQVTEFFPEDELDSDIGNYIDRRDVVIMGSTARVRYDIGTLAPGDGRSIEEPLHARSHEKAFEDARFHDSAQVNVAERMKKSKHIRGLCFVQVSLMSDLTKAARFSIEIVAAYARNDCEEANAIQEYIDARILGPITRSLRLFAGPLARFRSPLKKVICDFIKVKQEKIISSENNGRVLIGTRSDLFKSEYKTVLIQLLNFDARFLPAPVNNYNLALAMRGYHKNERSMKELVILEFKYWKRRARRPGVWPILGKNPRGCARN